MSDRIVLEKRSQLAKLSKKVDAIPQMMSASLLALSPFAAVHFHHRTRHHRPARHFDPHHNFGFLRTLRGCTFLWSDAIYLLIVGIKKFSPGFSRICLRIYAPPTELLSGELVSEHQNDNDYAVEVKFVILFK